MNKTEVVNIVNLKQAQAYIKFGLKPVDVFVDNDKLIFVFNKAESKPYFDKWCKYQLN